MAGLIIPVVAAVVGAVATSALAPKAKTPEAVAAPVVAPPTTMPTLDSAAVDQAKQLSIAQNMQRQGRASTILTGQADTGNGGKLGA